MDPRVKPAGDAAWYRTPKQVDREPLQCTGIEPFRPPARLMDWWNWGRCMYSRAHVFGPGASRFEDCRIGAAFGIGFGACAAFFLGLYWLMQPSVSANSGLADYRPPPKTVVTDAHAPWVPPSASEAFRRRALDEPRPEIVKRAVAEEPKKETKKQEARSAPRQARPVQQQANSFWGGWGGGGYAQSQSQARPSGSRPW
jgi:hypothetical protein